MRTEGAFTSPEANLGLLRFSLGQVASNHPKVLEFSPQGVTCSTDTSKSKSDHVGDSILLRFVLV